MITEYKRDGYHAHLVKSERLSDGSNGYPRYVAIYERQKKDTPSHYEVILLRGVGPSSIKGKEMPARLLVPSPEQFGKMAWTHTTLRNATQKMEEVLLCKEDE